MKKAVYYGVRDLRVEEVKEPSPGPGEIKVKVKYCGICGSDLHEYLHGFFPESPFGHEACGVVVEVGSEIKDISEGDHVVTFVKEGFAEYLVAPWERVLKIPSDMPWERAVVLEQLAGSIYAVERGQVKPSDTVFIAGAGPVGLMSLLSVKTLGCETVYVSEIAESRREKAFQLGASEVFNPSEVKLPSEIRKRTGGAGVDVSMEAVGIEASLKDSLASARYKGTVIVQGIFTERANMHMLGFVTKEMTMVGVNHISPERSLEWLTTREIYPEKIITSIVPLEQIAEKGFERLVNNKDEEIKIVIEP